MIGTALRESTHADSHHPAYTSDRPNPAYDQAKKFARDQAANLQAHESWRAVLTNPRTAGSAIETLRARNHAGNSLLQYVYLARLGAS